jgi:hypothetical protein
MTGLVQVMGSAKRGGCGGYFTAPQRSATTLVQLRECLILHCNKCNKIAHAKGAMAFAVACLYWCRWQGLGLR